MLFFLLLGKWNVSYADVLLSLSLSLSCFICSNDNLLVVDLNTSQYHRLAMDNLRRKPNHSLTTLILSSPSNR